MGTPNMGKPKEPPFAVGTRLRYTGRLSFVQNDKLFGPGIIGVVVENRPGRQGTGRVVDYEEDGSPLYDTTRDGWSVVETENGIRRVATKKNWEVIK